jgi:hypothetical protein
MSAKSDPHETAAAEYFYRRSLTMSELLPAIGVGVAAGVVAFYLSRLVLQRTPLVPRTTTASPRRRSRVSRTHGG